MIEHHHERMVALGSGLLAGMAWTEGALALGGKLAFAVVSGVLVTACWAGIRMVYARITSDRKILQKSRGKKRKR